MAESLSTSELYTQRISQTTKNMSSYPIPPDLGSSESLEEMIGYSEQWKVAQAALGRAPGTLVRDMKDQRHDLRCEVGYWRAMNKTLRPGEGWALITGQLDHELNVPSEHAPTRRRRTECRDCGRDIRDPQIRKKSDPSRCGACWSKKKASYNAKHRAAAKSGTPS